MARKRRVRITKGKRYKCNEGERNKKITDFDDTLLTVIGESYQKMRSVEGVVERQRETRGTWDLDRTDFERKGF